MVRFGLTAVVTVSGSVLVLASCVGDNPASVIVLDGGSPSSSDAASGGSSSSSGSIDGSVKDADTDAAADAAPVCPKNVPLTGADLDKEIGWKPAVKSPGACSAADLATLENNFKAAGTKPNYVSVGTGLSAPCQACVIAYDTDASWGPIVATKADNGATGFVNFGACFGDVEGAACGKSLQYEQFCYKVACGECATTAETTMCTQKAAEAGGMCKGFADATQANCPDLTNTAKQCNSLFDAVKTLCGS